MYMPSPCMHTVVCMHASEAKMWTSYAVVGGGSGGGVVVVVVVV